MQAILISFLKAISSFFTTILPSFSIDSTTNNIISNSILKMIEFVTVANCIIPINTIFQILGICLTVKLFKFTLFAGNWIIKRIRGG